MGLIFYYYMPGIFAGMARGAGAGISRGAMFKGWISMESCLFGYGFTASMIKI